MKSIKIVCKKILIIFMIILVLFPSLFSGIALAVESESVQLNAERAGNYVATFGINFYNNWSSVTYMTTGKKNSSKTKAKTSGDYDYTWPLENAMDIVTSEFGPRSLDNHKGMDFGAPEGTPVYSGSNGTVVAASATCTHNFPKGYNCGCGGGYGNHIVIDTGNECAIIYGHLSEVMVSVGDEVEQGQQIGTVGSTGWSTGYHLHYEFITNDISGAAPTDVIRRSTMYGYGYSVNPRVFIEDGAQIIASSKAKASS